MFLSFSDKKNKIKSGKVTEVPGVCKNPDPCCRPQGNCVSVGVTTLTVTASLRDSSGNSVGGLDGNATILFSTCWANFTDLSVVDGGTSAPCRKQPVDLYFT